MYVLLFVVLASGISLSHQQCGTSELPQMLHQMPRNEKVWAPKSGGKKLEV